MIELRRFEQLITLADTGNYRRAADKLGITHGALSQTVARLERECGTALFERRKRATVPTAYGETFLQAAREAVAVISQANREISLMQNLQTGRLKVGIDPVLSEGLLAPALGVLLESYPMLQFTALPRNWRSMVDDLVADRIDIFIGLAPDRQSDRCDYTEFQLIPPVFACRAGHEILERASFTMEDLIQFPFGGGDVPHWLLMQFVDAFPDQFSSVQSLQGMFLTTHDLGLMRQLLCSTNIIGLVPLPVILSEVSAGRVVALPEIEALPMLNITGVVATREDRAASPAAEKLSRIVLDLAKLGYTNYARRKQSI